MLEQLINTDKMMLAHWTYTKQEWKAFMRRMAKRNWLILILTAFKNKVPEVWISQRQVWIGKKERLNTSLHHLDHIDLREEGPVNVLHIWYKKTGAQRNSEIKLLVPKGKLREAIEVQRSLLH